MEEVIREVEWDEIRVSPFQPRRHFSEQELEELASSIEAVGLIHPPVVRSVMSKGKLLYYELIAGERRWRACKKAGLKRVKVLVRESNDEEAAKATLIENVQRVDLDPIETARAFKRLVDIFRMTQEEIADKVGKKRSTVANYLRLLTLPSALQDEISQGALTMGHAKAILSLESSELQENLRKMILDKQLTVRQAEEESIRLAKKKRDKKRKQLDAHLAELEEKLRDRLGTKVLLAPSGKEKGAVVLHYFSFEDLERLCDHLGVRCTQPQS